MRKFIFIFALLMPTFLMAANKSGTTGSCQWTFDTSSGLLTITGNGPTGEYEYNYPWSPWNSDRWSVTKVVINEGVTRLGTYLFNDCKNLTEVTIPSSCESIGSCAFQGCNIQSLTLPEGVKHIESAAFNGNASMTKLSLPSTLEDIGDYGFYNNSYISILTLPENLTTIGKAAFREWRALEVVNFPHATSLQIIEDEAFMNDSKLKTANIPQGVTKIGDYAFYYCRNMYSLGLPTTLLSIGNNAFNYCTSLTSLNIPSGVNRIGDSAFSNMWSLTNIIVDSSNTTYNSGSNARCIIETAKKKLIKGCKYTVIPYNVDTIGYAAFADVTIYSLNLPANLKYIERAAFAYANIEKLFAKSKTPIEFGNNAFYNISGGCMLMVPYGTRDAYMEAGWTEDIFTGGIFEEGYAVYDNNTLTFYADIFPEDKQGTIYPTLKRKNKSDLWGEHALDIKKVVFDDGFGSVPLTTTAHWFNGCKNLEEILGFNNIDTQNVTTMYAMFNGAGQTSQKLTFIDLTGFDTGKVKNMSYMFNSCSALKAIYVGDGWSTSLVTNSANMFNGCKNLVGQDGTKYNSKYIDKTKAHTETGGYLSVAPEEMPYAVFDEGVLSFYYDNYSTVRKGDVYTNLVRKKVSDQWGEHREEITKVVFTDNFNDFCPTTLAHWFNGCSNLTEVVGLEYLNTWDVTSYYGMFNGCSSIKQLDVTGFKMSEIKNASYMFNGCSELRILWGPEWVEADVVKSDKMFYGCKKLVGYSWGDETVTYNANKIDATMFGNAEYAGGYLTMASLYKPYAVYDEGTLTFYNDDQFALRDGEIYTNLKRKKSSDQWGVHKLDITKIVFDESFIDCYVESTAHWFNGCKNVEDIQGLEYLNTSNVTSMYAMFNGFGSAAKKIKELDLSTFNTGLVKNMSYMFNSCSSINVIKVGDYFTTGAVTSSANMFTGCKNLVGYAEGGSTVKFDPNITDVNKAFPAPDGYFTYYSVKLPYAVYNDNQLAFYYDNKFAEREGDVYIGLTRKSSTDKWGAHKLDIKKVVVDGSMQDYYDLTSTAHWFNGCKNLESIEGLTNLYTGEVTNMYAMFNGAGQTSGKLKEIDLSSFSTYNVTDVRYMFNCCSGTQTIYISRWDWSLYDSEDRTVVSTSMFNGCKKLVGGTGYRYNSSLTDATMADGEGYMTYIDGYDEEEYVAKNRFDETPATEINTLEDNDKAKVVYSLQGTLVGRNIDLNTLPKGLYIVNGKKVLLK